MEEQILMRISQQLEALTMLLEAGEKKPWGKMGRPTKEHIVIRYRMGYPQGKKMECVRATGLSIKTVSKYWNMAIEQEKIEGNMTLQKEV